jgi:hypothetical protein
MLTLFHSLLDNHLHGNPCQEFLLGNRQYPTLLPAEGVIRGPVNGDASLSLHPSG